MRPCSDSRVCAPPCWRYYKSFKLFQTVPNFFFGAPMNCQLCLQRDESAIVVVVVVTLGNEEKWKSAWAYLINRHIPTPTCLFLGLSRLLLRVLLLLFVLFLLLFMALHCFVFPFRFLFLFLFRFLFYITDCAIWRISLFLLDATPCHALFHSAQPTFHCNLYTLRTLKGILTVCKCM